MATTNPDLVALDFLEQLIRDFTVTYPDDDSIGHFDKVDVGYHATPTAFPYVSLHTTGSSAPINKLGRGADKEARLFRIDALINVEYEHHDSRIGFKRLTQIRWDLFLHLIKEARRFPGVEFVDFDEAYVQTFVIDDGTYQEQGFLGQVIIPIVINIQGAKL